MRFGDIIGSTKLMTSRPAAEVVELLNPFFRIVDDEFDRHRGFGNDFDGDAVLAVIFAPLSLENVEDQALANARRMAERLRVEVPDCLGRHRRGVGLGRGLQCRAKERFEYAVTGGAVDEAARLCKLSNHVAGHLVASSSSVTRRSQTERTRWSLGETVTLRGYDEPTWLAVPTDSW